MSDICKINLTVLKSYENDFKNELNNFNNKTYSTFSSSYLKSCSDSYVRNMASKLETLYKAIKTGYTNIDKWWSSYNENATGLENYLAGTSGVGSVSESSVRNTANSLPSLESYNISFSGIMPNSSGMAIGATFANNGLGTSNNMFGNLFSEYDVSSIDTSKASNADINVTSGSEFLEKAKNVAEGFLNWGKDAAEVVAGTIISVNATNAVAIFSLAEKTLTDLGFDVAEGFDNFYGNTKFGQGLVENSYVSTDVAENVSKKVKNVATSVENVLESVGASKAVTVISAVEKTLTDLGFDVEDKFDNFYGNTKFGQNLVEKSYVSTDVVENVSNWAENTVKSVVATEAVAVISVAEKTLTDLGFDVEDKFDNFYGNTKFGQGLVENSYVSTDVVENVSNWIENAATVVQNTIKSVKATAAVTVTSAIEQGLELLGIDATQAFDKFYENTKPGQNLVDNAYVSYDEIRSGKVLESVGATVATAAVSVVEGIGTLVEAIVDTATIAITGFVCMKDPTILLKDINAYLKEGDKSFSNTKEFFEPTMSFVSEKWVTGWFDSFYENTDAGQWLEENSYGFDTVRAVGTGVGYVVGVVALTILTCGIFGVATGGVGAAGAATSTASTMSFQTMMGLVAGYAGFGKGAEQAWGNGADLGEGLVAALATGVWEGFQMWAGAQIGAPNGWGTQLASKVVGSNANVVVQKVAGSVARLLLDTVDGAVEGFVVPAIDTIYADGYIDENGNYIEFTDDDGLFKRYTEVFDDAGGWKNVGIQGMVGFATSFAGEVFDWIKDARKFNSNANDVDINRMDNPKVDISEAELQTKINRYRELEAIINSEEYILYMDNVKKMYAQELRFDFEGLEKEFADLGNELAKYTDVNSIKQVDMDDKPDIDISITEDIDISITEDIDISVTGDIDISVTGDIDISVTEDIIGDVSSKIDAQESKNVLSDFKNLIETGKKSDSHVVDLMHKTFSDAFDDGNTEALAVLKMFNELKRNNQDLRVLIAPDSSKCYYNVDSKTIFIGKKHIDMSDTCTFAHELGHCLYDNIFGDEVPYNWRLISENAREISSFNTTMTNFCSNLEDISSHTRYLASREFEQDIKVKYGSLDKYRQRLTTKYSIKLKFMSEDKLRSTLKTFRYSNKDIDFMVKQFSDGSIGASELAGMQILYSKNVIKDRIFRTEYGDYCALSDIIDAVYGGTNTDLFGNELHLPYVHGFDYYTGDYTKLVSFHEIIANYTQLKITGNATSLEILKSIFGSEFSNCLEDVFSKFSYYG